MDNAPLSIKFNTSQTKTAIPLIADGVMTRFRLKSITQSEGTDTANPAIKFEFNLLDPAPTTEGGTVNPGFPIFLSVPLRTKESPETPEWSQQKVAQLIDAMLGTGDPGNKKNKPTRPDFGPDLVPQLIGKEMIAKVKTYRGKDDVLRNDLGTFTFPGDVAA